MLDSFGSPGAVKTVYHFFSCKGECNLSLGILFLTLAVDIAMPRQAYASLTRFFILQLVQRPATEGVSSVLTVYPIASSTVQSPRLSLLSPGRRLQENAPNRDTSLNAIVELYFDPKHIPYDGFPTTMRAATQSQLPGHKRREKSRGKPVLNI